LRTAPPRLANDLHRAKPPRFNAKARGTRRYELRAQRLSMTREGRDVAPRIATLTRFTDKHAEAVVRMEIGLVRVQLRSIPFLPAHAGARPDPQASASASRSARVRYT
jgi:hypothetical protein